VIGVILESVPPRRLVLTFDAPGTGAAGTGTPDGPSQVTFDIEPYHEIVRLTVTHENLADGDALEAISAGWPAVCANLKSLLETGHVLPRAPWGMPVLPRPVVTRGPVVTRESCRSRPGRCRSGRLRAGWRAGPR
jgi:Activator of Hsp90 ATPase homolog 1-like protein